MPYFDSFFQNDPTRFGEYLQQEKARQVLTRLRGQNPNLKTILEIGAGWGEFALLCTEAKIRYFALEANVLRAQSLRERGFPTLRALVPPIPIRSNSVDAVIALNVFEHMPDLRAAQWFLNEMRRVVVIGGLVCLNCPDLLSAGYSFWDADYTHNFPVTMRRLSQMYQDHNLIVVYKSFFSGIIAGPLAHPISLLAKMIPAETLSAFLPSSLAVMIGRFKYTFLRNVFIIGKK